MSSSETSYPVRFVWDRGGSDVHVCLTSTSSGESRTLAMPKTETRGEGAAAHHEVLVKLGVGRYEYR